MSLAAIIAVVGYVMFPALLLLAAGLPAIALLLLAGHVFERRRATAMTQPPGGRF